MTLTRSGADGRQTRLRLVHTGLAGELGILHDDGWWRFLTRLIAAAAGQPPPAYPAQHPDERLATLHRHGGRKNTPRTGEHCGR